jgi:ABC-2 type transport system ATP-binding protein
MSGVLSTTNLSKRFRSETALDGLNLDIPEGSIFGLVGPNGAGKTTTIKVLMNILQPTSGQATVLGIDSRLIGPEQFMNIGHVSENQKLPGWMTVEYFLQYCKPFYPTWDDDRATELLRLFDLPMDRKLKNLSRGMAMKAALASSLAYRPRVLVLDEPFGGLDPLVREQLIESLLESAGETTILISSHDLAEMESFASHIGFLEHGRLKFSEEMSSLSSRFREIEVSVESPADAPAAGTWPAHWMNPETAAGVMRFVDSRFDAERTPADIRKIIHGVRNISTNPMPLRAIFVTLARGNSKAE